MNDLALRHESTPRRTRQLSRRRLGVLLAASGGALAVLAACGEEKKLTRDDYNFPGAEKDASGNYKMQTFR
ncbi:MAG: hypothetical protein OXO54_04500 [Chloroflexota bacterium]|nr:hypothetical protein [Chloroflexota bacterium]MDE2897563.1 hypothetical protein [Chloroflexota bacterium]